MVIWSEDAREALKQIYNFIAFDSTHYARRVIEKIVENSEDLNSFPKMGRIVPEIQNDNIRELVIYSYRLIYEIKGQEIHIAALIHGKQKFPEKFTN